MRRIAVYGALLAVAIGTVAVGLDLLIETDEERIEGVLDEMRSAAVAGDAERLVPLLDLDGDGFEIAVGRDRERFFAGEIEALEDRLADGFDWLGEASLSLEGTTITISGDVAHAYGRVILDRRAGGDETVPIDLALRRDGDDWRVTRFRALTTTADRAARR